MMKIFMVLAILLAIAPLADAGYIFWAGDPSIDGAPVNDPHQCVLRFAPAAAIDNQTLFSDSKLTKLYPPASTSLAIIDPSTIPTELTAIFTIEIDLSIPLTDQSTLIGML